MTILLASAGPAFQDGDGPATQRNFFLPNVGPGLTGPTGPTGGYFLPENVPINFPIQDQSIITGFSARLNTELDGGESAAIKLLVNDNPVAGTVFLGPQPAGGVQNFDFPSSGYVLVAANSRFDVLVELRRLGFTGPGKTVDLSVTTKMPTP